MANFEHILRILQAYREQGALCSPALSDVLRNAFYDSKVAFSAPRSAFSASRMPNSNRPPHASRAHREVGATLVTTKGLQASNNTLQNDAAESCILKYRMRNELTSGKPLYLKGMSWLAAALVLVPMISSAHAGLSLEEKVGEYLIDVGYGYYEPIAGERLVLDFALTAVEDSAKVKFDTVRAKIYQDKTILVATTVSQAEIGNPVLIWTTPDTLESAVSIDVTFEREGETLATATLQLPVTPKDAELSDYVTEFLSFIAGITVTLLGIMLVFRTPKFLTKISQK